MVKKINNGGAKFFPAGWHVAAKPCDSCKSSPALLFCRKHTAFLCVSCDVQLHGHTKHERVWLCDVCEHTPAVVTCKADAAALCVTCDRDIHAANPLASRHERIPVVTFFDSAVTSIADNLLEQVSSYGNTELIPTTTDRTANINVSFPCDTSPVVVKSIDPFSVAADPFFDFGFAIPTELATQFPHPLTDCVVPVPSSQIVNRKSIDFTRCVTNSYSKSSSQSLSHSVSSSSMEVGVVPKENSILDKSNPYMLPVNVEGLYCTQKAKTFCAIDRQARVLRYKEKRKKRKFDKKIRYASRKAYAEMRPRVKGRFVKRTESTMELDVDRWLFTAESHSNSYGAEVEYGVVPSF